MATKIYVFYGESGFEKAERLINLALAMDIKPSCIDMMQDSDECPSIYVAIHCYLTEHTKLLQCENLLDNEN